MDLDEKISGEEIELLKKKQILEEMLKGGAPKWREGEMQFLLGGVVSLGWP